MVAPYRHPSPHEEEELGPVEAPPPNDVRISETQLLVAVLVTLALGLAALSVAGAS